MKTRISLALAVLCTPAFAGDLATVERAIAEKLAKHKSLQYTSEFTSETVMPGMEMTSTGKSTFEAVRAGNVWKSRTEGTNTTIQKAGGQEQTFESTILMIFDGKNVYSLSEAMGQKTAHKMKHDPASNWNPFDSTSFFNSIRENFNLKVLPDETVDGRSVYVIEARPKNQGENPMFSRQLYHYDKKTGLLLKSVIFDQRGKPSTTTLTKDYKFDTNIPDDRFVFKAPPGVQVQDMTKP